ncbi:MAG: DEAD/DEAH box helicase [Longimicrobiales bacterium]
MNRTAESGQPGHSATPRFDTLGLSPELLKALTDLEFTTPTPVQMQAIPAALSGRDVLGSAATGSGKTAAFMLPILQRLQSKPRGSIRCLVLAPTRELAAQIVEHANLLSKHTRVRAAAIYGGVGMKPQEDAIRRGVDILVATPGRLLDHCQRGYVNFGALEVLVLDEADRMLDMGFMPDIKRILNQLPRTPRQTLLFSATMPAPIATLANSLMRDPLTITVERKQTTAKGVTQALYPVASHLKLNLLAELLTRNEIGNAIVFCRTKHRANRVAERLEKLGFASAKMHGNRSQSQRTDALAGFKAGRYRVLVATDIVARGIDVEALEHVVNFDVPVTPEDYIHRAGRTGRAEAVGEAYTLYSRDEESMIKAIERMVGRTIERRTLEGFDYSAAATERLEVPIQDRIAAIRAQRSTERARAREKEERRARGESEPAKRGQPHRKRRGPGGNGSGGGNGRQVA